MLGLRGSCLLRHIAALSVMVAVDLLAVPLDGKAPAVPGSRRSRAEVPSCHTTLSGASGGTSHAYAISDCLELYEETQEEEKEHSREHHGSSEFSNGSVAAQASAVGEHRDASLTARPGSDCLRSVVLRL